MVEEKIRSFLAIELPKQIKEEAELILTSTKKRYPNFRFIPESNWHLTLHFLGAIRTEQIALLDQGVPFILKDIKPFKISLGSLGGFPTGRKHNLLWIGVNGDLEALKLLHESLSVQLSQWKFEIEERTFHPHITVARSKSKIQCEFEKSEYSFQSSETWVKEIVLFRSHLLSSGPLYTSLSRYPLGLFKSNL